MATKLTRLTHKIAIQLHLAAESCAIYSSGSRRPARKLLDTPSYTGISDTAVSVSLIEIQHKFTSIDETDEYIEDMVQSA
jgi:hypothetical protein